MFEQFDKSNPLPADDIWRYMKTSTLLMMLSGKVFIPTLSTLQKTEPTEGMLPTEHIEALREPVSHLFGDPRWFDKKATAVEREILEKHDVPEGSPTIALKIRVRIWLRELATRRLVWCWNQGYEESMALWQIYGDKGIAITSSPDLVKCALLVKKDFQGSFGKIHYIDREQLTDKFKDPECFSRPYYFKQKSFGFENEVRFVIAIEPTVGREAGHVIGVDFGKLVKRIVISPHMPKTEAVRVRKQICRLLPDGTRIPVEISEGADRRLGEVTSEDVSDDLADEIFGSPFKIDSDLPTALKSV